MQSKSQSSELSVIMRAKDLCRYVMTITEKCPKQYRFTFTTRLQNLSMNVVQNIYMANETYVPNGSERQKKYQQRLEYQHKALTEIRMLAYFAQLALEQKVILYHQYEQIALQSANCMKLLGAWINSDRKRFGQA